MIDAEWRAIPIRSIDAFTVHYNLDLGGSEPASVTVADVLERLGANTQIREAVVATGDVILIGEGVRWVISTPTKKVPTRQAWDCYQAIARHLIEAGRDEPGAR